MEDSSHVELEGDWLTSCGLGYGNSARQGSVSSQEQNVEYTGVP